MRRAHAQRPKRTTPDMGGWENVYCKTASDGEALGNVEYPLVAISPWFNLTRGVSSS